MAVALYLFACLCTFVVVYVASLIHERKKKQSILKEYGIPGPEPSLILGNWKELVLKNMSKIEVHLSVLEKWHKKYGRVFGYYVGTKRMILVTDVDVLRDVFIKEIALFTNRPNVFRQSKSLITLEDDRWRHVRRIVTPAFSAGKLKLMNSTMNQCIETLCRIVKEKSASTSGEGIDAVPGVQNLSMEILLKCAMALHMEPQKEEYYMVNEVKRVFEQGLSWLFILFTIFPSISILIDTFPRLFNKADNKGIPFLHSSLRDVYKQRKSMKGVRGNDLLQLLMDADEGNLQEDNEADTEEVEPNRNLNAKGQTLLTEREILDNALIFMLAGYETTSTGLAYTLYLLTKHQEVQSKLTDEVDRVIGENEEVTYDDASNMPYLEQVILESLRLYPPVVSFTSRVCKKDVEIHGYKFPAGSILEAPTWLLHRDPEYWPNPNKFDPDRFGPENKSLKHQPFFCPFGLGPRKCVGERFAMMEMKLCLAKMLQRFRFVPSERFENQITTQVVHANMKPINGVWVQAEMRSKAEA